jgi:transcriptional regulator with XRE-family HTH domain
VVDVDEIADARRQLGRELAAHRNAAGYNQIQFARFTGYSRSTLANVETGRQAAPRDFWQRCDETLAAGGVFVAGYEAIEELQARRRHQAVHILQAEREARLRQVSSGPAMDGQSDDGKQPASSEWSPDLTAARVDAVHLWSEEFVPSCLSTHDALASSSAALRWLVAPHDASTANGTGWRRVGQADVERIRGVRRQLKAMDNAHGGGAAFLMAVTYLRREVAPLLSARYEDATGAALFGAVAELSLDVGWMAYDAGGHRLGRRYMTQALRLSHAAKGRLFGGRVLAALSHQALHLGQTRLAVDLARAARAGTAGVAPPRAQAMLAAMEAMAQAADSDEALCTDALVAAERALEQARPGDDNPDWLDFDEGGLWGHAARAYRYLKKGHDCARYAREAFDHCQTNHGRTRAQRAAILAAGHLQLGDLEQAAALGSRVVTDAWNLHSRHVYEEVAFLVRALDGKRASGSRDFLEQAREYLVARASS